MLLGGVLLTISLAVMEVVESAPLEEEKIETVDMAYLCLHMKVPGKPDDKSPVLLIHGFTLSQMDWDGVHQALALRTNRRICAVDLRNHGDSAWNDRMDVEAMTADVMKFLDMKEMKKVNIVGHSLGGKIAMNFAIKNPERVDSIVAEDVRPGGVSETNTKTNQAFMKFLRAVITSVPETANYNEAQDILLGLIQNKMDELGANTTMYKNTLAIRRDDDGKWQWKANMALFEKLSLEKTWTPITGVYEGPALFIYGTLSLSDVEGDKDNIMKLFPKSRFVPVEGAGHTIHANYDQFKDEVVNFLNNGK